MKLLFKILSFLTWLTVVPLSLFPLFKVRTVFEIDVLITTLEKKSAWVEVSYMRSIKDLWESGNYILFAGLVLFVLVMPAVKYAFELIPRLGEYADLSFLSRFVFVDIFVVSLLLVISYNIEVLQIKALPGLYVLMASVFFSYISIFIKK